MLGKKIERRKLFSLPLIAGCLLVMKDSVKGKTESIHDDETLAGCAICGIVNHKKKFIIRNGKAYHKHCL